MEGFVMDIDNGSPEPTGGPRRKKQPGKTCPAKKRTSELIPLPPRTMWSDSGTQCLPLVADELIFVRVERNPELAAPVNSGGDTRGLLAAAANLQQAFPLIWERIPRQVRDEFFEYWHDPRRDRYFKPDRLPSHTPLIRILDVGLSKCSSPECTRRGLEMTFPLMFIRHNLQALPLEIARLLAEIQLWRTGELGPLHQEVVDGPMEELEAQLANDLPDEINEPVYDAKQCELAAEFRRQLEARITKVLRGWGFVDDEGEFVRG
jgi:hypothetical protein